jgi:hypothetical protein
MKKRIYIPTTDAYRRINAGIKGWNNFYPAEKLDLPLDFSAYVNNSWTRTKF